MTLATRRRLFRTTAARIGSLFALLPLLLVASPAQAYIGPGAGLTAIGTALALVASLFLAVAGFIWYPVRRMLRRRRAGAKAPGAASVSTSAAKADGRD